MNVKKICLMAAGILFISGVVIVSRTRMPGGAGSPRALRIVTTIFPEYDWTREILGGASGGAELTLLSGGADLHSYQPSVQAVAGISEADIFIYVGGESDVWVEDALRNAVNGNMTVLSLMSILGSGIKTEEIKDGMQGGTDENDGTESDEHVWLSVRNAMLFCGRICDALCEKDSDNAETYRANLASYTARLSDLDRRLSSVAAGGSRRTLLFADRFPFRYFTDDYGLDYYAAFRGCSAETEAGFETVIFLAKKMDSLGLDAVCKIEGSDTRLARTVINSSGNRTARIITMDSMQSVTLRQAEAGATYLGIMESNLTALEEALR